MAVITLMLAVNFNVSAQLGGALNRAKNAVQSATGSSTNSNNATENVISNTVQLSSQERSTVDKLLDESKRTAPRVKELSDYQRDYDHIRDWFGKSASKPVGSHQTVESAKAFKAAIEARTAENLAMFCVLFEVPNNYDCSKALDDYDFENKRGDFPRLKQAVRNAIGDNNASKPDGIVQEIDNYLTIINLAADLVPQGKVEHRADGQMEITIDWSKAGVLSGMVQERDGKPVIIMSGKVAPLDNATFVSECTKLDIVQTLLKKENSETQHDKYWLALASLQRIVEAQRNSK